MSLPVYERNCKSPVYKTGHEDVKAVSHSLIKVLGQGCYTHVNRENGRVRNVRYCTPTLRQRNISDVEVCHCTIPLRAFTRM